MPKLIILSGISGSGKSTYAATLPGVLISRDSFRDTIRAHLHSTEYFPLSAEEEARRFYAHIKATAAVFPDDDLIIDQTTTTQKSLATLLRALGSSFTKKYNIEVHRLDTPYYIAAARNAARRGYKCVPSAVLRAQREAFMQNGVKPHSETSKKNPLPLYGLFPIKHISTAEDLRILRTNGSILTADPYYYTDPTTYIEDPVLGFADAPPRRVFCISDTHFNHENIIKYCERPFSSVHEMNEVLISNWNRVVQPEDLVVHVGDFILGAASGIDDILPRLNGEIILVRGNHDTNQKVAIYETHYSDKITVVDSLYFKVIRDGWAPHSFLFGHDPLDLLDRPSTPAIKVHGHIHNDGPFYDAPNRAFNVSADMTNFEPVPLSYLASRS